LAQAIWAYTILIFLTVSLTLLLQTAKMAQMWEIVGGADKGGILVREGEELKSPQTKERLSTGALVEEVELKGERLSFKRVTGTGPEVGWISIKLPGKDLAVKTLKKPVAPPPTK